MPRHSTSNIHHCQPAIIINQSDQSNQCAIKTEIQEIPRNRLFIENRKSKIGNRSSPFHVFCEVLVEKRDGFHAFVKLLQRVVFVGAVDGVGFEAESYQYGFNT